MLHDLKNAKLLVVAAHPDDEILGCGGTVARLVKAGWEVYSLILGEGVTSRASESENEGTENALDNLKRNARSAMHVLGVRDLFLHQFPDNRFDEVALLDIIQVIEKYIDQLQPQVVFTHALADLNIDHQRVHQAVLTATRPMQDTKVKEVYTFETLSSTEWNYPVSFVPDTFVDITSTLSQKLDAMSSYISELRDYPHPRSLIGIQKNAEVWGMKTGRQAVEAFQTVRRCF